MRNDKTQDLVAHRHCHKFLRVIGALNTGALPFGQVSVTARTLESEFF
jgi:hypothetical protein